jgi:hypothetical protein
MAASSPNTRYRCRKLVPCATISTATISTMFRFCNRCLHAAFMTFVLVGGAAATKRWSSSSSSSDGMTRELEGLTGPFSHMACRACTKLAKTYVVQGVSGLAGCFEADDATAAEYAPFRFTSGADCIFKSNYGEVVMAFVVLVAVGILLLQCGKRTNQFLAPFLEGSIFDTRTDGAVTVATERKEVLRPIQQEPPAIRWNPSCHSQVRGEHLPGSYYISTITHVSQSLFD